MRDSTIQTLDLENEVNLCGSCCYVYPDCASDNLNIVFGSAKGDDNICCCNKYEALQFRHPSETGVL